MNKDSLHQKLNSPYTSHNRNRSNAAPIWQMDIENSKSQGGSNLAINENWRTWHLGHRSTTGVVINVSITNHTSKTNPHAQLAVELGVGRVTKQGREKSRWYLVSAARVSTSEAEASAQGGGEGRRGEAWWWCRCEWVSEWGREYWRRRWRWRGRRRMWEGELLRGAPHANKRPWAPLDPQLPPSFTLSFLACFTSFSFSRPILFNVSRLSSPPFFPFLVFCFSFSAPFSLSGLAIFIYLFIYYWFFLLFLIFHS